MNVAVNLIDYDANFLIIYRYAIFETKIFFITDYNNSKIIFYEEITKLNKRIISSLPECFINTYQASLIARKRRRRVSALSLVLFDHRLEKRVHRSTNYTIEARKALIVFHSQASVNSTGAKHLLLGWHCRCCCDTCPA